MVRIFRKEPRTPLAVRCLWAHTARPLAATTTNAVGEYEIRGISAGEFSLWVCGGDGSGTVPPLTDFVVDATDMRVDAELRSPTGILVHERGEKMRDRSITIAPLINSLPKGAVFLGGAHTVKGALMAPLHVGPHRIVVDSGAHIPWWADVEVVADEVVVVTPERLEGLSVTGRVVDSQRHGLEGVRVSLEGRTSPGEPSVSRTVWTEEDGTFTISGLPDASATISFDDPSEVHMSAETLVRTSLGRPVVMTLERGVRLAGRVEPRPISSAVQCRIIRQNGEVIARTVFLDDEGRFEIRGLESTASRRVMFVDDDYNFAVVQSVDIRQDADLGVVRLAEPRHLTIQVMTSAGPVGDAVVVVYSETWEFETATSSGPDGTYDVPWPDDASALRVYRPSSSGRRALLERNATQFLGSGTNVVTVE